MASAHESRNMGSSWVLMAILAVVSIVGGVLALANPFAASMAATLLAGWFFAILGVIQIIQAFRVTDWSGFLWALAFGVLTLVVGGVLLLDPLAGMVSLTVLVAVLFLVTGVAKVMFSLSLRPVSGWAWVLVSGIVSLLLGVMILANFPWSAANVLGILLGIELLSNGILFLFVALGLRKLARL
ncbi:DUF308 domain-containing protein [Mesorhizobium sp. Z1-4]|uniref:HdeD family acid-resistance protein n=1 Tax=Mesorhizobium sp. Z1-4 TaxID=2448478 RepID=UPI000FDA1BCC|nr:DUF308 domain-containing protein [Mesorhizobium sp. Z1-4]